MQFLYVYLLLLLLLPLALLVLSFLRANKSIEGVFSKQVLERLRYKKEFMSNALRYRLFLVALIFMIVALARPVVEKESLSIHEMKNSCVIAVDMSQSMKKTDIYPSRESLAKQKLLHILELGVGLDVGVVFYAKDAYMVYPLSEDKDAIHSILKNAKTKMQFAPNSNLFAALEASAFMLKNEKNKNIILLSDGGENIDRLKELRYLKQKDLKLFSLALTKDKMPFLEILSQKSGGDFAAYTWGDRDINQLLASIKKQTKSQKEHSYKVKNYEEYFSFPLGLALLLLFFVYLPSLRFVKMILLISLMANFSQTAQAGVLDFWTLKKASEYYEAGQYHNASKEYAKVVHNASGYYNYANALYKEKEFIKAIKLYKKALGKDKVFNAKIYHNIANAHLKRDKLDVAKTYLVKSLQEHKFSITQENLKLVQKELARRKKLLVKDGIKVQFKNRLKPQEEGFKANSTYSIKLERLVLSEEERWMKYINKQKAPLFLQKIPTTRRSDDAQKLY